MNFQRCDDITVRWECLIELNDDLIWGLLFNFQAVTLNIQLHILDTQLALLINLWQIERVTCVRCSIIDTQVDCFVSGTIVLVIMATSLR